MWLWGGSSLQTYNLRNVRLISSWLQSIARSCRTSRDPYKHPRAGLALPIIHTSRVNKSMWRSTSNRLKNLQVLVNSPMTYGTVLCIEIRKGQQGSRLSQVRNLSRVKAHWKTRNQEMSPIWSKERRLRKVSMSGEWSRPSIRFKTWLIKRYKLWGNSSIEDHKKCRLSLRVSPKKRKRRCLASYSLSNYKWFRSRRCISLLMSWCWK